MFTLPKIKELFQNKDLSDIYDPFCNKTILHEITENTTDINVYIYLKERGANFNVTDDNNVTAFMSLLSNEQSNNPLIKYVLCNFDIEIHEKNILQTYTNNIRYIDYDVFRIIIGKLGGKFFEKKTYASFLRILTQVEKYMFLSDNMYTPEAVNWINNLLWKILKIDRVIFTRFTIDMYPIKEIVFDKMIELGIPIYFMNVVNYSSKAYLEYLLKTYNLSIFHEIKSLKCGNRVSGEYTIHDLLDHNFIHKNNASYYNNVENMKYLFDTFPDIDPSFLLHPKQSVSMIECIYANLEIQSAVSFDFLQHITDENIYSDSILYVIDKVNLNEIAYNIMNMTVFQNLLLSTEDIMIPKYCISKRPNLYFSNYAYLVKESQFKTWDSLVKRFRIADMFIEEIKDEITDYLLPDINSLVNRKIKTMINR